ncbi:MAG: hypothetical protein ACYTGP_10365 [Planctomycetota bacterium]|jgi:hypothetical protein
MLTAVASPLRPVRRRLDQARPYAIGAAWFFVAFSLVHLAWVVSTKWGDPAGLTSLYMATTSTGETIHPWGLGYDGMLGLLVACGQFLVVGTAAVMSILPTVRWRRFGHGVLIGWAGLWMLGLMKFAGADPAVDSIGAAALSTLLFGSTVYRALPRRKRVEVAAFEVEFEPDVEVEPEPEPETQPEPEPLTRREHALAVARKCGARARGCLAATLDRTRAALRSKTTSESGFRNPQSEVARSS